MTRFVKGSDLYDLMQQKSAYVKDTLWVCSPNLGTKAHQIFSQNIIKSPPRDAKFVFRVNETSVKKGEVDPYEVQYFIEHFKNVKTYDSFDCKIFVFDDSTVFCSANLTNAAFECNTEAGVLLENQETKEIRDFFMADLWDKASTIKNLEKYKRIWNRVNATARSSSYKLKKHTQIKEWTEDGVSTWYYNTPFYFSKKTKQKIMKEATLPKTLGIMGDIHISAFRNMKLGDLAIVTDFNKKRGLIEVELGRVFDKCKVETDDGDYHFAYEILKTYKTNRDKLVTTLDKLKIHKKSDIKLTDEQVQTITNTLSQKHKPKKQTHAKTSTKVKGSSKKRTGSAHSHG